MRLLRHLHLQFQRERALGNRGVRFDTPNPISHGLCAKAEEHGECRLAASERLSDPAVLRGDCGDLGATVGAAIVKAQLPGIGHEVRGFRDL